MEIDPYIRRVNSIYNIILVLTGTLGNCLTLCVLTNRRCQKSSFTVYLSALAIADTLALWLWPFGNWFYDMFEIDLELLNIIMCKLVNFLTYIGQHASSWFVVAMAAERFYCIYFPLEYRCFCRQKTGFVVAAVIMAVLVCVDSHLLYGLSLFEYGNETFCDLIDDDYARFFNIYFAWIDISVLFLFPAIFIVIFNVAMVIKIQNWTNCAVGGIKHNEKNEQAHPFYYHGDQHRIHYVVGPARSIRHHKTISFPGQLIVLPTSNQSRNGP